MTPTQVKEWESRHSIEVVRGAAFDKFRGNQEVAALLDATGDAELIFVDDSAILGRKRGFGDNEMGKALMYMRNYNRLARMM